jgi:hypothetical protein
VLCALGVAACGGGGGTSSNGGGDAAFDGAPEGGGPADGAADHASDTGAGDASSGDGGDGGLPGDGGDGGPPGDGGHPGDGGEGGASVGYPGLALVSAGVSCSSTNYEMVVTLSQSPGGNGVSQSTNYQLRGGVVGVTQPH